MKSLTQWLQKVGEQVRLPTSAATAAAACDHNTSKKEDAARFPLDPPRRSAVARSTNRCLLSRCAPTPLPRRFFWADNQESQSAGTRRSPRRFRRRPPLDRSLSEPSIFVSTNPLRHAFSHPLAATLCRRGPGSPSRLGNRRGPRPEPGGRVRPSARRAAGPRAGGNRR
jgi:hypothetical protein